MKYVSSFEIENEVIYADDPSNIFINVLCPKHSLNPLNPDGITDNTYALQDIVNYVGKNGGGVIFFPTGKYLINGTINVNYRHISFVGENRASSVIVKNDNMTTFIVQNVNFVYFNTLFFRNTNSNPSNSSYFIHFINSPYCEVEEISMYNSCRYIKISKSQGFKAYDVQMNNDEIFPTDSVIGFLFEDRCVSSRLLRCTCNFINIDTAYGIYTETYAQDIYVERFETTGCLNAILMKNTTAKNTGDIIIKNSIFDLIKGPCIRFIGIKSDIFNNTCIIDGIYCTPYNNSINCLRFENSDNIMISNVGVNNPEKQTGVTSLSFNGCKNITVTNCEALDIDRNIAVINCKNFTISGNVDNTSNGMVITGSSRINVVNNITGKISGDAPSSQLIVSCNNASGGIVINSTSSINANNIPQ